MELLTIHIKLEKFAPRRKMSANEMVIVEGEE
jgi:hypothetical protein